jgi:hypothetical protein
MRENSTNLYQSVLEKAVDSLTKYNSDMEKYDESQPRDSSGRWSSSAGDTGTKASDAEKQAVRSTTQAERSGSAEDHHTASNKWGKAATAALHAQDAGEKGAGQRLAHANYMDFRHRALESSARVGTNWGGQSKTEQNYDAADHHYMAAQQAKELGYRQEAKEHTAAARAHVEATPKGNSGFRSWLMGLYNS